MTTFELEVDLFPVCGNARETVNASQVLAQTASDLLEDSDLSTAEYLPEAMTLGAADLLGETVAGGTADYAPEASASGSAEFEDQDLIDYGAATGADGVPLQVSIETAEPCTEGQVTQPSEPETDAAAAALKARRKAGGARGHYMGETVAAYVGHNIGARSIKPHSNHHDLGGVHFQIRTINGKQNTCTGAKTDPDKIIVAAKKRDGGQQGFSRYLLHGVLRADALAVGKKSRSRGHVNTGHYLFSLSQVQKVELGSMMIPDELVVVDTSEQRTQQLDHIKKTEPGLDDPTITAARAFLAAASLPAEPEATNGAPEATDATIDVDPDGPEETI